MENEKDTFDNIQTELTELLLHIEFARRKNEKMGQLDRSAYRLLAELSEKGPKGINSLATKFLLDKSTLSRQTAALVSKGYVQRIPDPNEGRISLLDVTPIGRKKYHEVRNARKELYRKLLGDWDEEDQKQLEKYLMQLNKSMIDLIQESLQSEISQHETNN